MSFSGIKKFPNINSLDWNSSKSQSWDTKVKTSGSGKVRTMTTWRYPRYTITTSFAILNTQQYRTIMGFFASTKGGTEPFLWLDPEDNHEQGIVLGKGIDRQWNAIRKMGDYIEPVEYIEDIVLYADGKPLQHVDNNKGILTTKDEVNDNAVITADYTYYWKVRLNGEFTAELKYNNIYKSKAMKLVTVR